MTQIAHEFDKYYISANVGKWKNKEQTVRLEERKVVILGVASQIEDTPKMTKWPYLSQKSKKKWHFLFLNVKSLWKIPLFFVETMPLGVIFKSIHVSA